MNQKTDIKTDNKAATVSEDSSGKTKESTATISTQESSSETASTSTKSKAGSRAANALPPELTELVIELRDTVKRIDPKRHTLKTLRRAMMSVNAILADIDSHYPAS